jgi:phage-related protein (TIGR01555 family)
MTFQFKSLFAYDSFRSLITGLGVPGRDKVMSMSPSMDMLTYNMRDLENLYRGNWLAKKIVDIPAFDCTRSWRTWDGEQDQVQKLEDAEKEFGLQRKMLDAMIKARLYGGSAMLMGIKGHKFNDELDLDKVGQGDLKFIHVVEKWMIQAGPRVRDITSPWFGEPSYYMRSNVPIIEAPGGVTPLEGSSLGYAPGETIWIHPSRVVRMVGIEYPDVEHSPDAWGDSVLASVYEAIRDAGLVTQSLANMIADSKVDVFKIPGLTSTLSTQEGTNKLISYLANANVAKSVVNSLVIDKEIDWERIQTKFEGLPEVLQAYLLICSAGADIPSTRMLSREPSGQNATGESDTRNYYDRLSSEQAVILTPTLARLDEVLIRHSLGDRPKEITYDWNPLWQMTDTEKADITLKKAQAYKIDVDTTLIPAQALVIGRQNQLIEDGVYPGLETAIDDLKDAWEEEAEFLPVQQMGQQSEMQKTQQGHEQGMQEKQLTSQKEQFGSNKSGDDDEKTNNNFGDEGGQGGLGFMTSQATSVERRKKKFKRPFVVSDGYNPDEPRDDHGRWSWGSPEAQNNPSKISIRVATGVENKALRQAIRNSIAKDGFKSYDKYPIESIPVNTLIATQDDVDIKTVDYFIKNGHGDDYPNGTRFNGKVFIDDGHHRIEAAVRSGSTSIKMYVQDLDKAIVNDDYQEEQHPRGEGGRWSSSGKENEKPSRVERMKERMALEEGDYKLHYAAGENATFEEAKSLLKESNISALTNEYGDLKYYYETGVVPEMKGESQPIRLKAKQEFLVGYHGTTKEVFLAAKKEGLKPKGSKGADEWARQNDIAAANRFTIGDRKVSVYLAADPEMAASFAKIASTVRQQTPVLLEIRIPKEYVKNAVPDRAGPADDYGNPSFLRYKGIIKPEWIVRELSFDKYKSAIHMGIQKGNGEFSVTHDADDPLTIYAIVFDALPMEMHE